MRRVYDLQELRSFIGDNQTRSGKVVAVSGGFDPIHVGHIRYLKAAATPGGFLVVILNGDSFLTKKKGRPFMPLAERAEILAAIGCVDAVVPFTPSIPGDQTVSEALEIILPNVFAKGGDRTGPENIPEWETCQRLGIRVVTGVGGTDKPQSSSWLHGDLRSKT
jgi:cytidyltransferase-like protein